MAVAVPAGGNEVISTVLPSVAEVAPGGAATELAVEAEAAVAEAFEFATKAGGGEFSVLDEGAAAAPEAGCRQRLVAATLLVAEPALAAPWRL